MPLVREGSEGDMMRILIVEDDRELAAALDDALRYEGYATSLATTGVEALRSLPARTWTSCCSTVICRYCPVTR